jgi:hypothetical protein
MLYGGRIRAEGTVDELLSDTQRTVIKSPRLNADVIEKVEGVLRDAGVAIESVESPRQRLEDLFMDIVERARQEHLATSGALSGGETADFLRSDEPRDEAAALIDELQAQPMEVESAPAAASASVDADTEPSVVDELMASDATESTQTKSTPAVDHDAGLIDDLLGGDSKESDV